MTTGTYSNYGSVFQYPSGTAYPALVVDYPEFTMEAKEVTNNLSGGVDEYIYSGLQKRSPVTISILGRPGSYATLKAFETSKSTNCCVLSDSVETETGQALVTSVKKEAADQQNPDAVKLSIVFQWTG